MTVSYEKTYIDDFLKREDDRERCRAEETLLSGQNLLIGTVVGKVLFTIPTTGTLGSGTNGTCTAVTGGAKTKKGTYKVTCTTANAADADGVFRIEDPDGAVLGDAVLPQGEAGTIAFTDPQINLTLNYATGYNSIGDYYNIVVSDGSLKLVVLSWTAVDGSQKAYGLLLDDCDASAADKKCAVTVRDSLMVKSPLKWRVNFTGGGTTTPVVHDTLTGLTTTTTSCRIKSITVTSGTWAGGDAAGYFIVDQLTGDFAAENVEINSSTTDDATVALTNMTQALVDLKAAGIIEAEEA